MTKGSEGRETRDRCIESIQQARGCAAQLEKVLSRIPAVVSGEGWGKTVRAAIPLVEEMERLLDILLEPRPRSVSELFRRLYAK